MNFPAEALQRDGQPGAHERRFTAAGGADHGQEAGRGVQGEIRYPLCQVGGEGFAAEEKVGIRLVKKQQSFVGSNTRRRRIFLPRGTELIPKDAG